MTALRPDSLPILTLSEQLDAMLLGWLERRAEDSRPTRSDAIAVAVVTVASRVIEEIEAFCARWNMTIERLAAGEQWAALQVKGPLLPVMGFSEITGMYRP